ncbi:predicted protein [Postia placenta Mad-698-R]|uniref:Uncharacterized protein n=1 Tax=Postia placenta MAD-698-R-SB12 TaxID=670580 RepID=A0A1X6MLG4_9APHY|nr:hypothetical protein POSPLADRAFT_1158281 [Postia placenta MAD-698-R-SB12]EED84654.1 predicted protein [Postia placenta Mad-698-R]OSX56923.1 hypothetical protein POSPLADRAFT_1158281 [Postia placenta MAD-698-R-SB12]
MLYALDSWPFVDGVRGAEHMDFLQQQGAQARDAAHPAAVLATWACVARKARHSAAQRGDRIVFGEVTTRHAPRIFGSPYLGWLPGTRSTDTGDTGRWSNRKQYTLARHADAGLLGSVATIWAGPDAGCVKGVIAPRNLQKCSKQRALTGMARWGEHAQWQRAELRARSASFVVVFALAGLADSDVAVRCATTQTGTAPATCRKRVGAKRADRAVQTLSAPGIRAHMEAGGRTAVRERWAGRHRRYRMRVWIPARPLNIFCCDLLFLRSLFPLPCPISSVPYGLFSHAHGTPPGLLPHRAASRIGRGVRGLRRGRGGRVQEGHGGLLCARVVLGGRRRQAVLRDGLLRRPLLRFAGLGLGDVVGDEEELRGAVRTARRRSAETRARSGISRRNVYSAVSVRARGKEGRLTAERHPASGAEECRETLQHVREARRVQALQTGSACRTPYGPEHGRQRAHLGVAGVAQVEVVVAVVGAWGRSSQLEDRDACGTAANGKGRYRGGPRLGPHMGHGFRAKIHMANGPQGRRDGVGHGQKNGGNTEDSLAQPFQATVTSNGLLPTGDSAASHCALARCLTWRGLKRRRRRRRCNLRRSAMSGLNTRTRERVRRRARADAGTLTVPRERPGAEVDEEDEAGGVSEEADAQGGDA